MSSPEINPRDLRVSDAEREHTINLLERATGRGLIDLAEFTDRSAKVLAARTRADLNALLLDLPGLQLAGRPYQAGGPWYTDPAEFASLPSARPGDVLELKGYGSRQFTGHWIVPSHIVVSGAGASTKLDFTQAQLTSNVVTVEFRSNLGGSAYFRVPEGTLVRLSGLDARGCAVHNHLAPRPDRPPMVLNLVGVKRYGTISIRPPYKGFLQRLRDGLLSGR